MRIHWPIWLTSRQKRSTSGTVALKTRRYRPSLEALEDRLLLSAPEIKQPNVRQDLLVNSANATHFEVDAPTNFFAQTGTLFTVAAKDSFGNTVSDYDGTVAFSSTDKCTKTQLPANATLTNGVGIFTATLTTPLTQYITATDTIDGTLTGTSPGINVCSMYLGCHFTGDGSAQEVFDLEGSIDGVNWWTIPTNLVPPPGYSVRDPQIIEANGALWCAYTATFGFGGPQPAAIMGLSVSTDGQNWSPVNGIGPTGLATPGYIDVSRYASGVSTGFQNAWAPNWFIDADGTTYITFTASTTNSWTNGVLYGIKCKSNPAQMLSWTDPAPLTTKVGEPAAFAAGIEDNSLIRYGGKYYDFWDTSVSGYQEQVSVSTDASPMSGWSLLEPQAFSSSQRPYLSGNVVYKLDGSGWRCYVDNFFNGGGTVFFDQAAGVTDFTSELPLNEQNPWSGPTHVSINGSINSIRAMGVVVIPAPAATLKVQNSGFDLSGSPIVVTVTAQDGQNNLATGYSGTVEFATGDLAAVLPAYSALSSGIGLFSITFNTAGNQAITATDSMNESINGVGPTVSVSNGSETHFWISAPANVTAGNPFVLLVTALDGANNTATDYTGTVHFSTADTLAALPSNATLSNGVGIFAALLGTAGTASISVVDTSLKSVVGTTNPITVAAGATTHFEVTYALPSYPGVSFGPTSFAVTGSPFPFTVTALDKFNNLAPTYAGTLHFTSSDTSANAVLPVDTQLTNGLGIFSATLATAGIQSLTATDGSISSASGDIVTRGLVVTEFTPLPTGFAVTFDKPFDPAFVAMYTQTGIPDDIMLATLGSQVSVRGSVVFNADDSGFTFVKTATASALGSFNPTSGLLAAGKYTVTLRTSLSSGTGFQDSLGVPLDGNNTGGAGSNYVTTFTVSAPPVAVGIPDFAAAPSNTDALFLPSTIGDGGTFDLTYGNHAAATATVTFSTAPAILQSNIQNALNALPQIGTTGTIPNAVVLVINDTKNGANVQVTFQNALATATNQLLTSDTPGVSVGLTTINVPNNVPGNGIPVALSSGLNVTSASFTLEYNPAILNITGAVSKIPTASFTVITTLHSATSATAILSLSSPTAISSNSSAITIGSLLASVPISATAGYGSMQLLHFNSEQLNGTAGPITVTGQDAVQVVAYFGDASGTGGPLSLADVNALAAAANLIPNTVLQTLPGFSAFPTLDPVIIGDVALQNLGGIVSTDVSAINQELISLKTAIPYAPIGLASATSQALAEAPVSLTDNGTIEVGDLASPLVVGRPRPSLKRARVLHVGNLSNKWS
jgi:hypothetical protein